MFVAVLLGFLIGGSFLVVVDQIFPGFLIPFVAFMLRITGVVLIWCGVSVYIGRVYSVGADKLISLPNPNIAKIIHVGKSGAKILNMKKVEPNRLRGKTKIFNRKGYITIKDTGEPLRLAGHDVFITSQDAGHTIPPYICDLVSKWKKKYGVRNEDEFLELYNQIKNIKSYSDLEKIEFLKPVMADPEKRKQIFDMSLDDLRNMRELLFDGRTVDVKAYLDWAEGATPYDNETIIDSTIAQYRAQDASLRYAGGVDWARIVLPLAIILIVGAIAYRIFFGG